MNSKPVDKVVPLSVPDEDLDLVVELWIELVKFLLDCVLKADSWWLVIRWENCVVKTIVRERGMIVGHGRWEGFYNGSERQAWNCIRSTYDSPTLTKKVLPFLLR